MNKKNFPKQVFNRTLDSNHAEITAREIEQELNKEYPKFLKAIYSKKLTQKQKRKKTTEFINLLQDLADTFND